MTAPHTGHDTPLALLGYGQDAARALREVGLCAVSTPLPPAATLPEVLEACSLLAYSGALVHPSLAATLLDACAPDTAAQRAGEVDALAFSSGGLAGSARGTHTLADALLDTLDESGYPVRGARALLIGQDHDLRAGLALTRLGLSSVTVAAGSRPTAEALARELMAGVVQGAVARSDPALGTLAERADLLVLTGGALPAGVIQPFHALLDLTGRNLRSAERVGASVVPLSALPRLRLARRLLHATGQRFRPEVLEGVARGLG